MYDVWIGVRERVCERSVEEEYVNAAHLLLQAVLVIRAGVPFLRNSNNYFILLF